MSQANNYQDLIINNNGVMSTAAVANLVTSVGSGPVTSVTGDANAFQGLQMANQFAICANPGSTPVLVPCITPMLLQSPQTNAKLNGISALWCLQTNQLDQDASQGQARQGQAGQHQVVTSASQQQLAQVAAAVQHQASPHIQLATNSIAIPAAAANMGPGGPNNLPFGISYINLSSLTGQPAGTFPIQIALNSNSANQQITLPLASITQLTNELQLGNATYMTPQIKFEADLTGATDHMTAQSQLQQHQENTVHKIESTTHQEPKLEENGDLGMDDPNNNGLGQLSSNNGVGKRGRKRKNPSNINQQDPNGSTNESYHKLPATVKVSNHKVRQVRHKPPVSAATNPDNPDEILCDNKGRPFLYQCNQCPKKFTQNSRLTAHLRCHSGIRPYTCTQCGFSFTQKSYLIRHAAVHKEDRPFTCSKCLKTYKHYGSLANHRKLHCKEFTFSDTMGENNNNNTTVGGSSSLNLDDDLDDTIQRAIDSATILSANLTQNRLKQQQQQHHQQQQQQNSNNNNNQVSSSSSSTNSVLLYTNTTPQPQQQQQHNQPIIYTTITSQQNSTGTADNIIRTLPGSGPVVFPNQQQQQQQQQDQLSTLTTQLIEAAAVSSQNNNVPTSIQVITTSDQQHHQYHQPTSHSQIQYHFETSQQPNSNDNKTKVRNFFPRTMVLK